MRQRSPYRLAAIVAAVALLATACGGGEDPEDSQEPEGVAGGELRVYNAEPAYLVPMAANDQPSLRVIRQLYRGLVTYDNDGTPVNDLAESIESEDNRLWTIKLKDGFTFTNGEPVDADAFLRAWNDAAYGPNARNNNYFFARIAGHDQMQGEEPEAETLSGLTTVDDLTFTVELSEPFSGFPAVVGYPGFFPVAQACLDDFDACNEAPIGNGPYQIEGEWERDVQITLVRNDDFAGDPGMVDSIIFRLYEDDQTAYADFQAGELDIMENIPPARYQEALATYGDRIFEQPNNSLTFVGLPLYDERFADVQLRRAFSLAIDREAIIDAIFDGRFTPAEGVVSPLFDGAPADACEFCRYDVPEAQRLYDEAGGFDGTLELWANAGVGHEDWLQAFGDQLNAAFGLDYELKVDLQFAEYLEVADAKEFTGPFRLGWSPDYPVLETYLQPLYGTGASSNHSGYANPEFDDLIRQGDNAPSLDEAIPYYQQAEYVIVNDLPVIPMWFGKTSVLQSEKVEVFAYNTINEVEYHKVAVRQD